MMKQATIVNMLNSLFKVATIISEDISIYNFWQPTHRFFENKCRILSRIHFGAVHLWPTSKGKSFCGGLGVIPLHTEISTKITIAHKQNHLWPWNTLEVLIMLLWVPLFGGSQPCGWLTGKFMPKMASNRISNLQSRFSIYIHHMEIEKARCILYSYITRHNWGCR